MIKIDISVAIFFYLLVTVVGVLAVWVWFERGSRLKPFQPERKDMRQCAICSYVYIDMKYADLSRCPRCKGINKKGVDTR